MAEYVNGKELHLELAIYHEAYQQSLLAGTEKPRISEKLGHAFLQIATRMASRPNFSGYSYKDDMISDAIMQCISKVHTYDPARVNQDFPSGFAWVSQVAWNSFVGRIKKEQHQSSVKAKLIREKLSSDFIQHGVDADNETSDNSFVNFLKENDAFIDYNEIREQNEKKQKLSSLTHRNKTPYKRGELQTKQIETDTTLEDFLS